MTSPDISGLLKEFENMDQGHRVGPTVLSMSHSNASIPFMTKHAVDTYPVPLASNSSGSGTSPNILAISIISSVIVLVAIIVCIVFWPTIQKSWKKDTPNTEMEQENEPDEPNQDEPTPVTKSAGPLTKRKKVSFSNPTPKPIETIPPRKQSSVNPSRPIIIEQDQEEPEQQPIQNVQTIQRKPALSSGGPQDPHFTPIIDDDE